MIGRLSILFLAVLSASLAAFSQEKGKETTLRTGRKIWMLNFSEMEMKGERGWRQSAWTMTYRTTLAAQGPALEKEFEEIWRLVRPNVERQGYKDAFIFAEFGALPPDRREVGPAG